MTTLFKNNRRPNLKIWICPIDGIKVNSRGAAAYLRNKYGILWNQKYLLNPELLMDKYSSRPDNTLNCKITDLLYDIEFDDIALRDRTIEEICKLIIRIRIHLRNNNNSKLLEILKCIYPITSSKIIVKRKH